MLDGLTRALAAVLLVAVAGCTAGESRPAPSSAAVRTVVADDVPVIGPGGLGRVKLGMTLEDLLATGEVGERLDMPEANCPVYDLKRARGWVGVEDGVAIDIWLEGGARTAEGLRFGESRERMKELYPTVEPTSHGFTLKIDDRNQYFFGFEGSGNTLTVIGFRRPDLNCLF